MKDYEKKTGVTPENAEIEYTSDGNAVITLTDAEGNVLDVYNIDPFTGVGTESDGGEVNLPQTGYSVVYNYIMLAAAAMVLFGIYAMAKSRKRDEEYSSITSRKERPNGAPFVVFSITITM